MELPCQFDNITQRFIDDLRRMLRQGSRVSMAAASFSIYAFEAFNVNFCFKDSIHETVFLRNLSAPATFRFTLQWLRVSQTSFWMRPQFLNEAIGLGKDFWLTFCKMNQIYLYLVRQSYFTKVSYP